MDLGCLSDFIANKISIQNRADAKEYRVIRILSIYQPGLESGPKPGIQIVPEISVR